MAKLRGYVQDDTEGDYIPDVSIILMNSKDQPIKLLGTSNDDGDFEFEQPAADSVIQFSRSGYEPLYMNINMFPFNGVVEMTKSEEANLDDVTVKSIIKKKPLAIEKPNYTLPIVLGCISFVTICVWGYKKFV